MRASLEQYHYMIAHSSIGFVGVGVSHRELIRQYAAAGARLTVRDKRPREALGAFGEELERLGVRLVCGPDYLADITEEVLFRTPGMKYHTPELDAARARGTAVTSEMELFFALCPCPVYAVTGSDGKTPAPPSSPRCSAAAAAPSTSGGTSAPRCCRSSAASLQTMWRWWSSPASS